MAMGGVFESLAALAPEKESFILIGLGGLIADLQH
jgi:hypothetical protein